MVFFQSRDRTSKHYSSESYEESLPDCPYPWIFGVGHVPSKSETLTNTNTKIFPVSHTEYVRESSRNSYVICAYDGDAPRWTNTPAPLPQANSIPPVSASSSYVLSWSFINTSIHMTFEHVGSINQCVLGDSVPLGNPASSSALTMPNYGASSSMSVRLQSVPPVDINMHPDSGAAPSPLSTIDDFEADESLPPVASQSSKAKGKKKAKF
ncbi:uncharacterized protein LACBIDRAFT_326832 [Laccaria bicolor S238N-H82]|uniref:Predicted protein n=1 Tax=Laccaria bicolor (strain S238N-H82 / ATCC MYA-4686) TaxID=486041 RepID=B0D9U4_LACBS|nr:uncharacterized protein LACBIDRAFT_326832 [Laccaria bicolor S238N-H82]EDR08645.1 predicted protein [Laccaria bicolor S238N-H82]|eukprot:XP_001880870.1 predicted protein [Laccaria bicolor S238N-H82]